MSREEKWREIYERFPNHKSFHQKSWLVLSGALEIRKLHQEGYFASLRGRACIEYDHRIRADADRTLSEVNAEELFRVIHGFALHVPEIGYCQGLNFVAALCLEEMARERGIMEELDHVEAAFWVLIALIENFGIGDLYRNDQDHLWALLSRFCADLEKQLPKLFVHLLSSGFPIYPHAVEWFTTLYCNAFSFSSAYILDLLFQGYEDLIYAIGLYVFQVLECTLMKCSKSELILDFKQMVLDKIELEHLIRELIILRQMKTQCTMSSSALVREGMGMVASSVWKFPVRRSRFIDDMYDMVF